MGSGFGIDVRDIDVSENCAKEDPRDTLFIDLDIPRPPIWNSTG